MYEEQTHDVSKDPFSKPSPFLDRLAVGVRALEEWYAADFERRVTEIAGLLRAQISEELRSQFTSELNAGVDQVRKQYEERGYAQFKQWELERQALKKEIEELQNRVPSNDVLSEISSIEAAIARSLEQTGFELERSIPSAAALGQFMQARAQQMELQAYLKGLKFAVEKAAGEKPENRPTLSGFISQPAGI